MNSVAPSPRVLIASTGIVYHTSMLCKMAQKIAEPSSIPLRDAELYFNRHPCRSCPKEQVTVSDERTVVDFSLDDLGVEHAQYFQGAGVAFTSWDEVFVGVGDTAREAADDALESAAQAGWSIPAEASAEAESLDDEISAHDDCEHDGCDLTEAQREELLDRGIDADVQSCACHDECELHHYAAFYVRGSGTPACDECRWFGQEANCAHDPRLSTFTGRGECSKWTRERERMQGLV